MATFVGWVSGSDDRGTLALVYGALSTILFCTWDSMHANVPSDDDTEITKLLRQFRWTAFGIICPEWVAVLALIDWFETRYGHKETLKLVEVNVSRCRSPLPPRPTNAICRRIPLRMGGKSRSPHRHHRQNNATKDVAEILACPSNSATSRSVRQRM